MKYTITREMFETFEIIADSLTEAMTILDACNIEPIEVTYGDINNITEEQ